MRKLVKLDLFEQFNERISYLVEWVGLFGLLLMMFITCTDVVGSKVFKVPVPGAIDFVMLAQLVAIAFAVAASLLNGRHVEVEFFVPLLPKRVQSVIGLVVDLLGLALFVVITWRMVVYGHDLWGSREVTSTVRLPLYPLAYGVALACLPVCLIYLRRVLVSGRKAIAP